MPKKNLAPSQTTKRTKVEKKQPEKKESPKISQPINQTSPSSKTMASPKTKTILMTGMWVLIFIASFIGIDYFVQYLNNDYSAAVVNGARIPRSEFYKRMEWIDGTGIVDKIINEELIRQEASKKGIKVTSSDVDKRIQQIQDILGGKDELENALKEKNLNKDEFRVEVEVDILTERLIAQQSNITDEDLKKFFDQVKAFLFPSEPDAKFEDKKEYIRDIYIQQKSHDERTDYIQSLRINAKIQNNVAEKPSYGFLKVTNNIYNNLMESLGKK